jgi:hypothetical protein
MIEFDLSMTPLAAKPFRAGVPDDFELMILLVALLLRHDRSLSDLKSKPLCFAPSDLEPVARVIETNLTPVARDYGSQECLRERLRWWVGIRVILHAGVE